MTHHDNIVLKSISAHKMNAGQTIALLARGNTVILTNEYCRYATVCGFRFLRQTQATSLYLSSY
jgi:hypothetical protein